MENNNEEISLIKIINIIIKGKKIIFLCVAVGVILSMAVFFLSGTRKVIVPIRYESIAVIEVGTMKNQIIEDIGELVGRVNYGFFNSPTDLSAVGIINTRLVELKSDSQDKGSGDARS